MLQVSPCLGRVTLVNKVCAFSAVPINTGSLLSMLHQLFLKNWGHADNQ